MSDTVPVTATVPPPTRTEPRLVSGEAVELDVRVARVGSRVPALLVDIFIEVFLFATLAYIAGFAIGVVAMGGLADGALVFAVFTVLGVVVFIGYPVTMETFARGRTVGKFAVGLRVVRDDGGPIRFRQALTRALVAMAVEWPGLILPPLTWVASLITMIANPHGKRLGDLAAGTIVIHDRAPESWGWVPAMPRSLARWARTLDLVGLDDDLALAVRHFLARNRRLREPARSRLGYLLARQVAAVTNPPPPAGTPGWAYLAAVIAERHRRAAVRIAAARRRTAALWPTSPSMSPGPSTSPSLAGPASTGTTSAGAGGQIRPAAPG